MADLAAAQRDELLRMQLAAQADQEYQAQMAQLGGGEVQQGVYSEGGEVGEDELAAAHFLQSQQAGGATEFEALPEHLQYIQQLDQQQLLMQQQLDEQLQQQQAQHHSGTEITVEEGFHAAGVRVPPHRMTPLREQWMDIYAPLVEQLGLQVRSFRFPPCYLWPLTPLARARSLALNPLAPSR
jgi:hypothetical protein